MGLSLSVDRTNARETMQAIGMTTLLWGHPNRAAERNISGCVKRLLKTVECSCSDLLNRVESTGGRLDALRLLLDCKCYPIPALFLTSGWLHYQLARTSPYAAGSPAFCNSDAQGDRRWLRALTSRAQTSRPGNPLAHYQSWTDIGERI